MVVVTVAVMAADTVGSSEYQTAMTMAGETALIILVVWMVDGTAVEMVSEMAGWTAAQ